MKATKTLILLLLISNLTKLQAQQNSMASGGDAAGLGGSISFSIGQTDYATQTGSNGSAAQGVQQPFEIFTLSDEDFTNINLNAMVYPNPLISNIIISVPDLNTDNLTYQLYDIQGKKIKEGKITTVETLLDMQQYTASTYLLKLLSNQKQIKTFKIIKN
ncbi:T9SS type A sorting domain-containing protein [Flavobacterium sp.]|uniref:T9SS type A sorting domain-containing protein n=1 Tax=Flavobacterium sp. TaxID=239 RepID=UPI00286B4EF6|nr:T9SS type A sorting domain-containing protein [Flavobacterium sp.]